MSKPASVPPVPLTDVIFRISEGEVVAIFPGVPATNEHDVTIYLHNGGHSSGLPHLCSRGRLATAGEYADLKWELESLGYRVRAVQRFTARHRELRREECQLTKSA